MSVRNVLLITIDSLRADHTSRLGYDINVDPRIAELGERGATFQQAIANGPNTTASFPSILTGAHSLTYGPYGICGDASPFLSETLSGAGFETVGYHSNPHLGKEQGYPTGFGVFNDAVEGDESVASLKDRVERRVPTDTVLYRLLRRVWHYFSMTTGSSAHASADTISENFIEWLDQQWHGDRFFTWLHYMDVHYPFKPPSETFEELPYEPLSKRRTVRLNGMMQENPEAMTEDDVGDLLKLYDAEIRYTDAQIGRVLDALADRGILNETLVVVTADHGEAFGEHGRFGHHPYPYEELVRVPLFIAGPGVTSTTVDQQVSLLDLAPTILDLVDVETPAAMEGESFAPTLAGESIDNRTAMTISDNATLCGCRTIKWKYITRLNSEEASLYNLQADPSESTDVRSDHPDVVDRFESFIADYREKVDTDDEADIDRSPEVQRRLRNLGYVDE